MADAPSPFAFLDGALDRAEYLRSDAARLAALWPAARVLLLDGEGRALADAEGGPRLDAGADHADARDAAVLLGLDGEQAWFALPLAEAASPDLPRIDLRSAAASWPVREATAFAQARAVLHWRARHRYCGACGGALRFERAGWLGRCDGCGLEHYPRTDPAVIVAVSDGERLLLGRQANWPARRYSTLAGFVEPGETLEQTVAREVFEESAVRVRGCRYLASQPWPFPSSLMLGFYAEAEPDEPRANDEELEDARWFTRDEVGAALRGETRESGLLLSPRLSISRWLVECWYEAGGSAG
ncbi:NAD(+) diphosphatase [Luteimonas marina]|uniref:NAD(+) diphosphatase n=1 Tax=Luteimonas marina TaxID=488485 RepID=A0A5C5TZL2_9GAMM|nr:NAD(+) diphosphatase [Luteimonas marina]TWT19147.1 NAD(+) diphosphatase [Luteimonas marina]